MPLKTTGDKNRLTPSAELTSQRVLVALETLRRYGCHADADKIEAYLKAKGQG